jgi:6-phosphogluconolactonase
MSNTSGGIVVLILMLALSVFLLNCGSSNSRPSGVLFVTSAGATVVNSFAINLGNGDLSQLNTEAPTGSAPSKILLDPTGNVAYVLNTGSNSISPYTVNKDGSLSKASDVAVPGTGAISMTRDSAGQFLFVVTTGNQLTPQLVVFGTQPGSTNLTLATQTALTRVPSAVAAITVTASDPPNSTKETLIYVTSVKDLIGQDDNTLSEYTVDSSGNVTEDTAGGSPITTGTVPSAVLPLFTQANNLFVYVADGQPDNNLRAFHVCTSVTSGCLPADVTNATMTSVGSPVSVQLSPADMVTDATRSFLYVANSGSNSVSSFRINPASGALTALNPSTVSTGSTPVALVLHPNGEFLYIANSGSGSGEGSVSGFNVNITSGALSGGIEISSSAQPEGLAAK